MISAPNWVFLFSEETFNASGEEIQTNPPQRTQTDTPPDSKSDSVSIACMSTVEVNHADSQHASQKHTADHSVVEAQVTGTGEAELGTTAQPQSTNPDQSESGDGKTVAFHMTSPHTSHDKSPDISGDQNSVTSECREVANSVGYNDGDSIKGNEIGIKGELSSELVHSADKNDEIRH